MITIENEGNNIAPVYNRGEIVLNSTNKNKDRFKYLADIEVGIGGSGAVIQLGRLAVPPHPSLNGAGVIEFHNIVKDYITKEVNYNALAPTGTAQNNNFIRVIMKFGERFKYVWKAGYFAPAGGKMGLTTDTGILGGIVDNTPHEYNEGDLIFFEGQEPFLLGGFWRVIEVVNSTTIILNQDWQQSGNPNYQLTDTEFSDKRTIDIPDLEDRTVMAFNGAIDFDEQVNYDNDYDLDNDGKLITTLDEDKVYEVNIDDYITANFYSLGSETYVFAFVVNNGVLAVPSQEFGTLGIGPQNINNQIPSLNPTPNMIEVGDEYEVGIFDFNTNEPLSTFKFKVVERCSKFKNNKIVWLDRMGAWKSFNFELHKTENINVTNKTTFKRENIGEYNTQNWNKSYDTTEHQTRIENLEFNKSYTVNSDRLTQNQIYFLEDLFTSRFVYILENQNTEQEKLTPININDNNYDIADLLYRRRKTLSLTFKKSVKKFNN